MAAILVVDDEEDIRELVGIYLKNEGFKVYKAADGQEALKCLDDMQIDLAILDVMMADMDGIALCLEIRKKSNIPIIMLSAKDQDMDKVIGLSAGADDYLAKPFNPVELVARVKAHLARYDRLVSNSKNNNNVIEIRGIKIDLLMARRSRLQRRNSTFLHSLQRILTMSSLRKNFSRKSGIWIQSVTSQL